jgi:uncharacterized protein
MKAIRKNLAICIDGGGLRGIIPACALEMLEQELGQPLHERAKLLAGSSTGSIIASSIAAGLSAAEIHTLYTRLGNEIFRSSWRTLPLVGLLSRYKFPQEPLAKALREKFGQRKVGDFWETSQTDLVITTFDLVLNKTRYIKSWKSEYKDWPVVNATLASSAAPTYLPVFEGRYTDGSLGTSNNPCFITAYEAVFCLGWKPEQTTLISLGTGRPPGTVLPGQPSWWYTWHWLAPILGAFLLPVNDQQVHIVDKFFEKIDFRRFQVDLHKPIDIADPGQIPLLEDYGREMGKMILHDRTDHWQKTSAGKAPKPRRGNARVR